MVDRRASLPTLCEHAKLLESCVKRVAADAAEDQYAAASSHRNTEPMNKIMINAGRVLQHVEALTTGKGFRSAQDESRALQELYAFIESQGTEVRGPLYERSGQKSTPATPLLEEIKQLQANIEQKAKAGRY